MPTLYYGTDHVVAKVSDAGFPPLVFRTYDPACCAAEARTSGRLQLPSLRAYAADEFCYLVGFTCEVPGVRKPRRALEQVSGRWVTALRTSSDA